ncbi:hypothetical protein ACQZ44_12600 [Agrobacterium vitis]
MKPPKITPVENLTPEAVRAAHELVAEALRQNSEVLNIRLADMSYDGKPIGSYEISIRREP